jgi:hypothetical protein
MRAEKKIPMPQTTPDRRKSRGQDVSLSRQGWRATRENMP